jgi:hypothetical protein
MMVSRDNGISMMSNVDPRCLRICQRAAPSNEVLLLRREMDGDVVARNLDLEKDADSFSEREMIGNRLRSIVLNRGRRAAQRNARGRSQDRTA